ncbi:SGNH/GDSL hydrolase family protein [Microbacterium sp. YY-01]|uniref:SGNH/GDSL hydrolase family protein n=1 Tax=Microbacterium sp. YY-01 TaxID=3421634 RepID=UPI003D179CA1
MSEVRFVAIGDSFTEGVGDERADGTVRGWADRVAQQWANNVGTPIEYANLAIRGRLAWPIVEEQLEPALALNPTHLSFNAGGNDMLRPRADMEHIVDAYSRVVRRCDEQGVAVILLSGANPSRQLPLSTTIQRRGDVLSAAVLRRFAHRDDIVRALNWPDAELSRPPYWSSDRLHMNALGHRRVAARVLTELGQQAPADWWQEPAERFEGPSGWAYYREFVGPWVHRRLTGTSSGDGRAAKHPEFIAVSPEAAA